jgi:hypothetical protein
MLDEEDTILDKALVHARLHWLTFLAAAVVVAGLSFLFMGRFFVADSSGTVYFRAENSVSALPGTQATREYFDIDLVTRRVNEIFESKDFEKRINEEIDGKINLEVSLSGDVIEIKIESDVFTNLKEIKELLINRFFIEYGNLLDADAQLVVSNLNNELKELRDFYDELVNVRMVGMIETSALSLRIAELESTVVAVEKYPEILMGLVSVEERGAEDRGAHMEFTKIASLFLLLFAIEFGGIVVFSLLDRKVRTLIDLERSGGVKTLGIMDSAATRVEFESLTSVIKRSGQVVQLVSLSENEKNERVIQDLQKCILGDPKFELIISRSLVGSSEAFSECSKANSSVVVVRWGHDHLADIRRLVDALRLAGNGNVSAILVGVPSRVMRHIGI